MKVRYIIEAEPAKAAAISRTMGEIGVRFDQQENLCALAQDNIAEGIFMGKDLDWLPGKVNEELDEMKEQSCSVRFPRGHGADG